MSGEDKLNTAEHDAKGRCVRHPDIRLRKKKLLGGWKILIGHCPECCLEEMRRVRDEIEGGESKRKKEKKKDKKKKTKQRGSDDREKDGMSLTSDGYDPNVGDHHGGGGNGGRYPGSGGRRHHHREDGESEATGSTAQMSGGGSVVSEQYYREGAHMSSGVAHGGDFGRGGYHQPSYQSQMMIGQQPPPERTMVLSMAFIDPHTGQRGTYTGQVNSLTHKPDGKGTVYYNNGMIAEGSWSNGVLTGDGSSNGGSDEGHDDQGDYPYSPADRSSSRPKTNDSRSQSRNRAAEQDLGISGNLHLLSGLPGAQSRPRGASASVQSYNSRTSHGQISGSASVTAAYADQGSAFYGGSGSQYRPPQRGHHQHSQGFHGRMHGPPTMNKRGEYEP
ncbi:hypothetical protein HJC23_002544 [Cyclotella cryptica]|uniref:Uncharacterized protein n=1 Tax=Cyclotella cryptica TaxID=29204 RepID=A0ABD3QVY3_9STRA|eukprot:CCRYP_001405-RA/>CCRYP_001405-RA protein AED:0.33 eAED:0.33 QI:0/-1/0/1/-1/1/1/0/388